MAEEVIEIMDGRGSQHKAYQGKVFIVKIPCEDKMTG